ncbi:MAG: aldolase/citrate lyase family protein, partial [Alphaproteobacteria bacterium]
MTTTIAARMRAGECIGSIWLQSGSTAIADMVAEARPDAIVFDVQHGLWPRQSLFDAIATVRDRTTPIVRVAENTDTAICEALDMGAEGVIVPMVNTPEEAARAVAAARFAPQGHRSVGGIRTTLAIKPYLARANRDLMIAVMIETPAAVDSAEAIARTPGLDMVFVGTGDLGVAYTGAPDPAPETDVAVARVLDACSRAGVPGGVFCAYASFAIERRRQGARFVSIGGDGALMMMGAKQAQSLFATGGNTLGARPVSGATLFVSGANRGIGREIVRAAVTAGATRIYAASRTSGALDDLAAEAPERVQPVVLDVTDHDAVTAMASRCRDVSILINNAGVNHNVSLLTAPDLAGARQEMEVNYFGTLAMCRAFAPVLRANGGGAIVNMESILSRMPLHIMGSL